MSTVAPPAVQTSCSASTSQAKEVGVQGDLKEGSTQTARFREHNVGLKMKNNYFCVSD